MLKWLTDLKDFFSLLSESQADIIVSRKQKLYQEIINFLDMCIANKESPEIFWHKICPIFQNALKITLLVIDSYKVKDFVNFENIKQTRSALALFSIAKKKYAFEIFEEMNLDFLREIEQRNSGPAHQFIKYERLTQYIYSDVYQTLDGVFSQHIFLNNLYDEDYQKYLFSTVRNLIQTDEERMLLKENKLFITQVKQNYALNYSTIIGYRIDTRPPSQVAATGFKSRGRTFCPIEVHQSSPPDDTGYISISCLTPEQMCQTSLYTFMKDSIASAISISAQSNQNNCHYLSHQEIRNLGVHPKSALPHQMLKGKGKTYIYRIVLPSQTAIDVNKALGNRSMHEDQQEMAALLAIMPSQIIGYYEISAKYPAKTNDVKISSFKPFNNGDPSTSASKRDYL